MKIMRLLIPASRLCWSRKTFLGRNPGEVNILVQIYAAGVTPTELLWYPTTHNKAGEKRSRAVPGHEFSGVIAAVGGETVGFAIGNEVYGMNDWFADGAMAEYCITQPSSIAHKPPHFDPCRGRLSSYWRVDGVAGVVRSGGDSRRQSMCWCMAAQAPWASLRYS